MVLFKERLLGVVLLLLISSGMALAQVPPNISYPTPKVYYVTLPVNPPLAPTNTGGAVPQTVYGTVTTLAGGNQGDADGTGGQAAFNNIQGVAVDINSNVYVADADNNKIRKITATGIVTTYAGSGTYGNLDGPALSAAFKKPTGITVDNTGNVYISQPEDGLIRKIAIDGTVSTISGMAGTGFVDGTLAAAKFKNPTGLYAMPNGDIIVVDQGNHAIRKISGGNVTTIAGNGSPGNTNGTGAAASFNNPVSATADAAGNLYVGDFGNQMVRKITPAGAVTIFAGSGTTGNADGQSPVASFNGPFGLAIDGTLNAYVADQNNYTIRRIGNNGTVVIIAGNNVVGSADGVYTSATFTSPQSMVKDYNGNLYVIDNALNKVRKVVITGYTINRALPPGLTMDPKTGIITGTPTATSDPTDYVITAYNAGGSSTFTVNIRVDAIGLTFNGIPGKTTCDVDFDPGASSNFPITYTSSNPSVAIILNGKIHIVGVGTSIITANNGFGQLQQPLIVTPPIPPDVTVVASASNICEGTLVTYTATPKKTGYAYQWKVNGTNAGMNSNVFSSNTLHNGDKITCVITDNTQCVPLVSAPSPAVTASVATKATMQIGIAASVNSAICPGTPVTFTTSLQNVPDKPIYNWMVNGVSININSATLTYAQLQDGDQVSCSIVSAGTCLISQTATSNAITISILADNECTVKIPNTFTPNGDGVNDTWNLNLPSGYYQAQVSVFNRHGVPVYQSIGYGIPWNGTSNGKPLPSGTYYYIIEPKGTAQRQSGTVVILR